jgi:hypothetical protein
MLEDYKKDRSKTPETSNFFAYSKDIKTKAATELQESIANGTQLESIYIGPLSQGKLSNEIKIFLAKYRPGITLEVFLKSMTSLPPRPPRPK